MSSQYKNNTVIERGGYRNNSIDAVKAILAIGIVFMHFSFPGSFGRIISSFAQVGVPFFFMVSGYFAYKDGFIFSSPALKKKASYFLHLILIYCVIYIGYSFFSQGFNAVISQISLLNFVKVVLFQAPQIAAFQHGWFLIALLYVYVIYYITSYLHISKPVICIAVVLLIAECLITYILLFNGIELPQPVTRNAYLTGLPFFSIGIWIRINEKRLNSNHNVIWLIFVLGIMATIIESNLTAKLGKPAFYIGTILLAFSLFVLAVIKPSQSKNVVSYIGEHYSLWIYIYHPVVALILREYAGINDDSYIFPIIVVIMTMIISSITYEVGNLFHRRSRL